jgi:NAD(P)-dependent dehydrogenase (short-subunit alcohol dehydrogenase family)
VSRVFITGSADGLGRLSAVQLVREGHEVVLHARNEDRGRAALAAVPGAAGVLIADLASIGQTRRLATEANAGGRFDAVIHNAGIGYRERLPGGHRRGPCRLSGLLGHLVDKLPRQGRTGARAGACGHRRTGAAA